MLTLCGKGYGVSIRLGVRVGVVSNTVKSKQRDYEYIDK